VAFTLKTPASRTIVARNTAAEDAGSIHDDARAAQLGYRGGLVPGVALIAYLTPLFIEAWGEAWPQRGHLRARFLRPVYDGESVVARARSAAGGRLACRIERDGDVCVEAEASLRDPDAPRTPWRSSIPGGGTHVSPDGSLPPLALESLAVGQELSPLTYRLSLSHAAAWARNASDDSPWYRDGSPFDGPVVHPAWFARDAIELIRHDFAFKATVHAASDISYLHAGLPDRDYTVYGTVVDAYERKGNDFLVVDTLTVDQDGREIARNRHTSVIALRSEKTAR
jgi:acyl dehydratase